MFNRASLVRVSVTTVGTGSPLNIGAAIAGYRPLSVFPNGSVIAYALQDTPGNETGWGVVGGGGTTLTRNFLDSSTGSLLSLSGAAQLICTPLPWDVLARNLVEHAMLGGI